MDRGRNLKKGVVISAMNPLVALFISIATAILAYALNLIYAVLKLSADIQLGSFQTDITAYYNKPLLIAAVLFLIFSVCYAVWQYFFKNEK